MSKMLCIGTIMKHASLFSGIGGFDLAAEWLGWENIFQVEKDAFCQGVLKKNFKNTRIYDDITTFDGTPYRGTIDVLSGGFPCQPFSIAGHMRGHEDERALWPEMLRVIQEIRPRWVVGENVANFAKMGLDSAFADLENLGYSVGAAILPACAVNAPHQRNRIWIIAHASGTGLQGVSESGSPRTIGTGTAQQSTRLLRTDWKKFPTQSPICTGDDGLSPKLVRLATKAAGNAAVPQLIYEIFKMLQEIEK